MIDKIVKFPGKRVEEEPVLKKIFLTAHEAGRLINGVMENVNSAIADNEVALSFQRLAMEARSKASTTEDGVELVRFFCTSVQGVLLEKISSPGTSLQDQRSLHALKTTINDLLELSAKVDRQTRVRLFARMQIDY